jgi:hypothetical protein
MEDLHRHQQTTGQYRQQRAQVEDSLHKRIKELAEDKNHFKSEASRYQLEAERFQQENARLRKNQVSLDVEIMKTRQGSQEALDLESSVTTAKIESLKLEIQDWKDKVGSQRDLEAQKNKLEATCKRLEVKLTIAEEQNRTMSKRVTELIAETANGIKQQPANQPKFRSFLDSVAKNHTAELTHLRDTHDSLLKQYRSLEDSYRGLLLAREADRKELLSRQRSLPPIITDQYPRLLDDGMSVDHRIGKMPWDSESHTTDVASPGSSDTGGSRPETITETTLAPITMLNNPMQQARSAGTSSPVDNSNPFSGVLPRRLTASSTSSTANTNKGIKIKPNSEIRIYGRYSFLAFALTCVRGGAQNMGMKPKKEKKPGLQLG